MKANEYIERFYKNGSLNDKKIENALRKAADNYSNEEIIEVRRLLKDIVKAIDIFCYIQENVPRTVKDA